MTFLGQHSIDETNALIAAKDADMAAIKAKRDSLGASQAPDPKWDADWGSLQGRWVAANVASEVEAAAVQTASPFVPTSIATTETAYQGLLTALQNTSTAGTTAPGGFQDLSNRLQAKLDAMAAAGAPVSTNLNEPVQQMQQVTNAAADVDIQTIKTIDQGAKALGLPNPALGFPSLSDFLKKVPWWVWAVVGVGVFGYAGVFLAPMIGGVSSARRTLLPPRRREEQ
jgi:hypothetical protein